MLKKSSFYLLALIALFISCRKESDTLIYDEYTTSGITGYISTNLDAIDGATVDVNGVTTSTDEYGFFKIENVNHNGKIIVKIKKPGFFPGSRTLFVNNNLSKHVNIDLIPKENPYIFDSTTGGSLNNDIGLSLTFPANGVMDKNGQSFSGQVYVFTKYLNPESPVTFDEMPGTLIGVNVDGQNQYLQSYGMAGILMEDANGNALQVKTNEKVTLAMEIPDNMEQLAPSSIPLWYYDEAAGIWKEEGNATKVAGKYEGYITHFSFWNCDDPYPLATLKAKVLTNGKPINTRVHIMVDNLNAQAIGSTDDEGNLYAQIPADQPLTLQLLSQCDDVLFTQKIPALTINEVRDLGTLNVFNPSIVKFFKYEGIVTDCAGNPLQDGVVTFNTKSQSRNIVLDDNGRFSYEGFICNDNYATLIAKSGKDQKQSAPIYLSISTDFLDLKINACKEDLDEYIQLNFSNGESATLLGSFYSGNTIKGLFSESSAGYLQIISTYSGVLFPEATKEWGIKTFSYNREGASYKNENSIDRKDDIVHFVPEYKSTNAYLEGDFTIKNVGKYNGTLLIEDNISITGQFRFKNQ